MKKTLLIESLDLLGQGVAKTQTGSSKKPHISFTPKTLPGETIEVSVVKERKNISHTKLESVIEASALREEPNCPHFHECPSCHYLHTSYYNELNIKQAALSREISFLYQKKSLQTPAIKVTPSPTREHYRNRVQLHYRHKYLGYIHAQTDQVLEVPQCQVIRPELQADIDKLYQKEWTQEHTGKGHVELYWKNGETQIHWNQPYAAGGFSQVNEAVNEVMCDSINQQLEQAAPNTLLDFFAGKGNLSNDYQVRSQCKRLMADISPYRHSDYLQINLYDDDAMERYIRRFGKEDIDTLLIDPPRSGFPKLADWLAKLKPKHLIYVSCNPRSLAQDIQSIETRGSKFTVKHVELFDMFPGTYHFESLVSIQFKKHAK